jgi:3-polyprenyl-4-hydroxybenzoate decarboxylase
MTEAKVNSRICGFTHIIKGRMDGQNIIIDIDTPCEKIKKISHMEVPMMDLFDIKENIVMGKAREARCTSTCLVPCAVMHVCCIEAGFMSNSLTKEAGSISIDFI